MNHVAVNVGQSAMDSIVVVDQLLVIDSEQMEDRRVEIMPCDRVVGYFPSDVVGLSIGETGSQSGACHPG